VTIDTEICLAELRRRGFVPDDTLAVFAVGSITRGWANISSDYDFYVVTRTPHRAANTRTVGVPLSPPTIAVLDCQHEGRRWEVTYWADDQVDQILRKVSWAAFDSGESSLKVMVDTEEFLLERITTGLPLIGPDWVRRRSVEVADSAYRAFITTRSLGDADNKVEDAVGMLASGDVPSAVLAARIAFKHTVNAMLESVGNYGSRNPKWRARRVQEARLEVLPFETYWAVETMTGLDMDNPAEWINSTVTMCKKLAFAVEIQ
jgi:hypothetical protein